MREPRWWLLCLVYLGFVVYGSLVPLEWRAVPFDEALSRFAGIRFLELGTASRADWVANIVLYVPLGFLACAALFGIRARGAPALIGALTVFVLCVALAAAVEFTQIFFAPRTVSLNDLLAETIGSAIGVGVWLFGRWRVVRLGLAFAEGGRPSVLAALVLFVLAYGLFSLFPFDFVVSGDELAEQLTSRNHAWLISGCGQWLRCAAFWLAEVLAIAPLGFLLALLYPRWSWARFALVGIGAGLLLEPLQLLLVSGKAQGFSVLLRGTGTLFGAWVGSLLSTRLDLAALAGLIRRALPGLAVPYLLALTALSGWWSGAWRSLAQGLARLDELGWVPFYYHYWTSEPVAMTSLLSQLALYMPVGLAVWVWHYGGRRPAARPWQAPLIAVGLALVVEAGKLFAPGARPDPTNLLIAPAGAWLAQALASWFARVVSQVKPARAGQVPPAWPGHATAPQWSAEPVRASAHGLAGGRRGPSPESAADSGALSAFSQVPADAPAPAKSAMAAPSRRGSARQGIAFSLPQQQALPEPTVVGYLYLLGGGAAVIAGLLLYPVGQLWLAAALLLFGAALWRWPWLWLAVVPAALPVLDLTPWSGRVLLNAFDLFVLVGLAVAGLRLSGIKPARLPNAWLALALLLLGMSWLLSMGIGLAPAAGGDLPVASSHPPLAAWHVGKGLLWALLAVPLLRRYRRWLGSTTAARLVLPGAVAGLLVVVVSVLLERVAFVGLWDFTEPFRVTGPFASMRDGGGYIGAYIAFALPLLMAWSIGARKGWQRLLGGLLVAAVAYALLVTYARAAYLGAAVGLILLLLGLVLGGVLRQRWQWMALAGGAVALGLAALAVLSTGFAQERMSRVGVDLQARLDHWQRGLAVMGEGMTATVFGAGFGRYPALYLFAERAGTPPGTYEVIAAGDGAFLRLGKGQAVYLDQRVPVRSHTEYRLSVRLRAGGDGARLSLPLCEKALLYSFTCVGTGLAPDEPGVWQTLAAKVRSAQLGRGGAWPQGPVKLSLYNSGTGTIDVDAVSFKAPDGRELIANGGFDDGAARWLFVTDQAQPWHLDQLFLETFVAQGLLGLLALALLLVAVVSVLWPGVRAGRLEAVGFAAALAGLLSAGMLGSVVDAPRTAMLFYLGMFSAAFLVRGSEKRRRKRRRAATADGAVSPDPAGV
ncbi:VanZ family protein [Thiohalocapsa halophila]